MPEVRVKVDALAYERALVKTKLSQFEDDLDNVTQDELYSSTLYTQQWVRDYVTQQGYPSTAVNINCGDVLEQQTANIRYHLFGGDIANII